MKILLSIAPAWSVDYPYLGCATILGALRSAGFDCRFFDFNLEVYESVQDSHKYLWSPHESASWMNATKYRKNVLPKLQPFFHAFMKEVERVKPDMIGFTVLCSNQNATNVLIELLRAFYPNIQIICGGPAINPELGSQLVEEGKVAAAFFGDGEESVVQYLKRAQNDDPIPGVVFRNQKSEVILGLRAPNPKTNPIPDFTDLDLNRYLLKGVLPISFARGCIARCSFCSESRAFGRFRSKDTIRVLDEIKTQIERHGVSEFHCIDSLMNGNAKLLREICESLIADKIKINWGGLCRFSQNLTDELLELMQRAGCAHLSFGLESGSQHVLDLMKKDVKLSEVHRIISKLRELDIKIGVSLIVGFPGEEEAHFQETLDFLDSVRNGIHRVTFAQPLGILPGTEVDKNSDFYGIDEDSKSDVYGWKLKDGSNNSTIRKKRLQRLLAKIHEHGIIAPDIRWV